MTDPVDLNTPLLIIYLSAIEHLFAIQKLSL